LKGLCKKKGDGRELRLRRVHQLEYIEHRQMNAGLPDGSI
jgi:hypothetical protein